MANRVELVEAPCPWCREQMTLRPRFKDWECREGCGYTGIADTTLSTDLRLPKGAYYPVVVYVYPKVVSTSPTEIESKRLRAQVKRTGSQLRGQGQVARVLELYDYEDLHKCYYGYGGRNRNGNQKTGTELKEAVAEAIALALGLPQSSIFGLSTLLKRRLNPNSLGD